MNIFLIHEQSEVFVFSITPIKISGYTQHCSNSFCEAHLKPLPQPALTSTSNCIHEENGKYVNICIKRQNEVILWRHNIVYPVTLTTIRHSTAQHENLLGGHAIKQSSRASPHLFTALTVPHWRKCPWKNLMWSGNPSQCHWIYDVCDVTISLHFNV